jgi:hypothetical protein
VKFPHSLLYVLESRPPAEVVKLILKLFPYVTQTKNEFDMLPLHIACSSGSSSNVIKMLIEHDKTQELEQRNVTALDSRHNTPLHYLIKFLNDPLGTEFSGREVQSVMATCSVVSLHEFEDILVSMRELLAVAPQIIHKQNKKGETVIQIIKEYEASKGKRFSCDWNAILFPPVKLIDSATKNVKHDDDGSVTEKFSTDCSLCDIDLATQASSTVAYHNHNDRKKRGKWRRLFRLP